MRKYFYLTLGLFSLILFGFRTQAQINPHGTWETNFGTVILYYYDAGGGDYILEGEYFYYANDVEYFGTLQGEYIDNVFYFSYEEFGEDYENPSSMGIGEFHFSSDGQSFTGNYTADNGAAMGEWNGNKIADEACFPANVEITLADFSRKAIAELQIGDELLSYDFGTQSYQTTTVEALEIYEAPESIIQLEVTPLDLEASQSINIQYLQLEVTASHPIKTNRGFKLAKDLKVGDKLITETGVEAYIQNITTTKIENSKVYNPITGGKPYYINGLLMLQK